MTTETGPAPRRAAARRAAARRATRVHFLDVGAREYGDAVLCELAGRRILIDGGHPGDADVSGSYPGVAKQLRELLRVAKGPVKVDLLIVTHAHQDHIGCLPRLVQDGILTAEWGLVADPDLGWGREFDAPPDAPVDERVRRLVAGLREEPPSRAEDDSGLDRIMLDAVTLEQNYRSMLGALGQKGTRVVRYGRDDDDLETLTRSFADVGLRVLGPSRDQLVVCAELIQRRTRNSIATVSDALRIDAAPSDANLFRSLVARPGADALDAGSRPGPAINLQSLVTAFTVGGVKLLFGGDMQLADPQSSDPRLRREMLALLGRIEAAAPFALAKLGHHGSDNAFDDKILQLLGETPLFGICAGSDSEDHPNAAVLRLLDSKRDAVSWVRTDHNGLTTITFGQEVEIAPSRGRLSDPRPNSPDASGSESEAGVSLQPLGPTGSTQPGPTVQPGIVPGPGGLPAAEVTSAPSAGDRDVVEVIARIPSTVARVNLAIEIEPRGRAVSALDQSAPRFTPFRLGEGRALPRLLFVTSRDALADNVSGPASQHVLDTIRAAGMSVLDSLPKSADLANCLALVRGELSRDGTVQGVVLLGGYDVVPSQRLDALPASLRAAVGATADPDDFVVWNDDAYGERSSAGSLPVTRVPDGRSAELLVAALSADDRPRGGTRAGIRNVQRPFADAVFALIAGASGLLQSEPTTFDAAPSLDADNVYLMLHGDYADGSRFWGEAPLGNPEAVNVNNIPDRVARVVFTGCCWGALIVDQPARNALPGATPAPKVSMASIALRCLEKGATGFVGCTGAHYSPIDAPYGYFGGPLHAAFWRSLAAGMGPAAALFAAKAEYVRDFPHDRRSQYQQAIEYKTVHQYTCLGLGW